MKALEKAAKDRGEARAEPAAAPAESRPELTLALELLAADTPSPRLREEPRPDTAGRPEAPASGYYRGDAARAATVVQASQPADRGLIGALRDRPIVLFGAAAGLFALGFGAYVYLQIFHPGLFIRRDAVPPAASRIVEAPANPAAVAPQQLSTASVLQSTSDAAPAPPPPAPAVSTPPESQPKSAVPAPPPKPVAAQPAEKSEPAPRTNIVVKRGDPAPTVHPTLSEAYAALQAGESDRAARLYGQLLGNEPRNADALLGLAAIAAREGRSDEAARYYRAILEIEPHHAVAQSGLIGLAGRADPLAAESHLKMVIAREPTPYAYFTLGNLYADQALWAQAQQAYFQAHHLEPGNPDYAYNLAVALEHLGQPKLAVGFYRRALELAAPRSQVNFDPARARERLAALTARLE